MNVESAAEMVQSELGELSDAEKAAAMQAYMKTDMPFYGVQKAGRTKVMRRLAQEFAPTSRDEYVELSSALWALPHREEKYLAQGVATRSDEFIVPESMTLYERFVVEGAWWDFVDETATHMIRPLVLDYPKTTWAVVDQWVDDDFLWRRRVAIICQVGAKAQTDAMRLFDYCERRQHEKEFFIRKAIGWALRDYAKTAPDAVARFVVDHRETLSPLSFREATKHIKHLVDP